MRYALALVLLLSYGGCGDNGTAPIQAVPDAPTMITPDGTPAPTIYKISDVQDDAMPVGTQVEIHGAVITAIDAFGAAMGDLWIQDPAGGERSGVYVFGVDTVTLAQLSVGDLIDLAGVEKAELSTGEDTGSVTTLVGSSSILRVITKAGPGTIPAPVALDALAIGRMSATARAAEWEKWEGMLVAVSNVTEANAPAGTGVVQDATLRRFSITGGIGVASNLAAMPMTGLVADACLASVSGVLDYFNGSFVILPRATTDIATGGTSCPAKELSHADCSDGIDNDGSGIFDCAETSCVLNDNACRTVTTIPAIQATLPTGAVELSDVFVVAVSANRRNLWVSTTPAAATNNGLYISTPSMVDAAIVAGAHVRVIGNAAELMGFASMTETLTAIRPLKIEVLSAPDGTTPSPVTGQSATALLAGSEPYESVLVQLTNVSITIKGDPTPMTGNRGIGELDQGGTKFITDDDVMLLDGDVATCYASVTGFWGFQLQRGTFELVPIAKVDGGTCN